MAMKRDEYDDDGELDKSTIVPLIDGGTEGFKVRDKIFLVFILWHIVAG